MDQDSSDSSDDSGGRRESELDHDINRYECESFVDHQYTSTPNRINRPLIHETSNPSSNHHFSYQQSFSSAHEHNESNNKVIRALKQELAKVNLENGRLIMLNEQKDKEIARLISSQYDILQDFKRKLLIVAQEQETMRLKLDKYKRSLSFNTNINE